MSRPNAFAKGLDLSALDSQSSSLLTQLSEAVASRAGSSSLVSFAAFPKTSDSISSESYESYSRERTSSAGLQNFDLTKVSGSN
jgi:hypothetical protein